MADDIDIEEHDITQNPRMKGYLADIHIKDEPDLSLIDSDTDCSSPGMVFPEGESDDDLEVQDNRKFAFEHQGPIILGNKPLALKDKFPSIRSVKTNPEIVLKNAIICLEDCSEFLSNSLSYCKECQILFPTQNSLDSHNMSTHSFLVAMANSDHINNIEIPVSSNFQYTRVTGKLCHHCNKYFKDDNALIKHMYEELEGKKSESSEGQKCDIIASGGRDPILDNSFNNFFKMKDKEKEKKIVVSKHLVYYCNMCFCYYKLLRHLQNHISTNHEASIGKCHLEPFLKRCKLCQAVTTYKMHNLHVRLYHEEQYFSKNGPLETPVQLHEDAAGTSGAQKVNSVKKLYIEAETSSHQKYKLTTKVIKTKPVKIQNATETNSHQKYKQTTKVVKTKPVETQNATETNSDQDYKLKTKVVKTKPMEIQNATTNEEKKPLVKCIVCDTTYINIRSARLHNARYHPDRKTLAFLGPKVPQPKNQPQYLVLSPKDVIYKCGKCSLHFLTCIVILSHNIYNTKNKSCSIKNPWKCSICNKTFREADRSNHKLQHRRSNEIRCFEFHDKLYSRILCRCAKCEVYFEERTFLKHHKFGCNGAAPSEWCKVCEIKVNKISAHMARHMDNFTKSDFILINDFITLNESQENSYSAKIIELQSNKHGKRKLKRNIRLTSENAAKKAKIDTDELDFLYNCTTCNLSTGSYDDIVDHCQKHINIAHYRPVTRMCKICVMQFDGPCLNKHNSEQKILLFNYKDLLTDDWFKPFASVLEAQLNKIKSNTKYVVTRGVKMNLILDGPPEHTLYKCDTCKNYVDPSCVFAHTHTSCGESNFPCESCGIKFSSKIGLDNHENIHNKLKIDAISYRIVTFKNKLDTSFNQKLKTSMDTTIASDDEFENELRDNIDKEKEGDMLGDTVFFQCDTCKCCVESEKLKLKHKCSGGINLKMIGCRECDYVTSIQTHVTSHIKWHLMNKHITRDQITIKPFHNHKLLINSKKERKEHNLETERRKNTMYQCTSCKCIFATRAEFNIHRRLRKCSTRYGEYCTECDLTFHDYANAKHSHRHKLRTESRQEQLKIITLTPAGIEDRTIYKCEKCDIHFMKRLAFSLHLKRHSNSNGKLCKKCGLKFSTDALDAHWKEFHIKYNYRKEDFNIICKLPSKKCVLVDGKRKIIRRALRKKRNAAEPYFIDKRERIPDVIKDQLKTIDSKPDEIKDKLIDTNETLASGEIKEEPEDIKEENEDECSQLPVISSRPLLDVRVNEVSLDDLTHVEKKTTNADESETDRLATQSNTEIQETPEKEEHSETDVIPEQSDERKTDTNRETEAIVEESKRLKTDASRENDMNNEECELSNTYENRETEAVSKESEHINTKSRQTTKAANVSECTLDLIVSEPLKDSSEKISTDLKTSNIDTATTKLELKGAANIFQLYKCGACNVYFMKQAYCYRHVARHVPLDPLGFIACKLCSFQFPIEYLKEHMQNHHGSKKFDLDKVLIKEYTPGVKGMKFEHYFAKDKVQSRLVSTTTDDKETRDTPSLIEAVSTSTEDEVVIIDEENDSAITNNATNDLSILHKSKDDGKPNNTNIESTASDSKINGVITEDIGDTSAIGENIMVNVPVDIKAELTVDIPPTLCKESIVKPTDVVSIENSDSPRTYGRKKEKAKSIDNVGDSPKQCKFCNETFSTSRAKEFHESLDHLDAMKECPMCKESFNESILQELHLKMSGDKFTCCICSYRCSQDKMSSHASFHNADKLKGISLLFE